LSQVLIETSARHCHLSQSDLETLFGVGYKLNKRNDLSVPGSFAAEETVTLVAGQGQLERVRVVGPVREKTQVEISRSDADMLKINPPLRLSGDLFGSVGGKLIGPVGEVDLVEGIIVAQRHLHGDKKLFNQLAIVDGSSVLVKLANTDEVVFDNVIARVSQGAELIIHIDTDEAIWAKIDERTMGVLVK